MNIFYFLLGWIPAARFCLLKTLKKKDCFIEFRKLSDFSLLQGKEIFIIYHDVVGGGISLKKKKPQISLKNRDVRILRAKPELDLRGTSKGCYSTLSYDLEVLLLLRY